MRRILIRATNWVGDAVMSLPAIHALRAAAPDAHISVLARPWVGGVYERERAIDRVIAYTAPRGWKGLGEKWACARALVREEFDTAILFQNAFEAAALAFAARIPRRIGYDRDGRALLLTDAVPVPRAGETPRHERYYYLELLRRAGVIASLPEVDAIRLSGADAARAAGAARFAQHGFTGPVVGVSPGAAYGTAKRWIPERFAESASRLAAAHQAAVAIFGSKDERALCDQVAGLVRAPVHNFAGETTLAEFIDLAAACRVFLTNDSGAMHIASALGAPTVTVFGATDHIGTGPTGALARIVRQPVECAPCLLRECPIDHRCMTRVTVEEVTNTAFELWTPERKS